MDYTLMATVKTMDLTPPPPKQKPKTKALSRDLIEGKILVGAVKSRTHPNCGKTKAGWRERRNSSLSHVASSSVWLVHCILNYLIVLCHVTWSF
jgi:hypothetical protein